MPYLDIAGDSLYYELHGSVDAGETLVLAHGMGGNHAIWFQQLGPLGENFLLLTFDHRGFGNSTDREGSGRSAYVDDLRVLLDHLALPRVSLLGQSMGAGTCVGFTCRFPQRVRRLVIADSLHGLEESAPVREIMDRARAATADLDQIERVLGPSIRARDPLAAVLYRQINSFNATDRFALRGAFTVYSAEALAATGVPILFVAGEDDVLFPIEAIRLLHEAVADSSLVTLAGTGHSAFYENPEGFNQTVLDFLDK